MSAKKNPHPVQRLLAWLDEGAEIENYATHEIEGLPIEEVYGRLERLGVDSSLPWYIKRLTIDVSPAQKVLDLLDNAVERISPEEVEHLGPGDVAARLNSLGLNYRAGINEIVKLTEARFNEGEDERPTMKAHSGGIWTRLKIRALALLAKLRESIAIAKMTGFAASVAVAVALAFVFVISHRSSLEDKSAHSEKVEKNSQQEIAGLEGQPGQLPSGGATAGAPSVSLPILHVSSSSEKLLAVADRGIPTRGAVPGATEHPNVPGEPLPSNETSPRRLLSPVYPEFSPTLPPYRHALDTIKFAFGSAQITSESSQTLRNLGNALNHKLADQKAILIEGYTDNKETKAYNNELSQRRAVAVRDYLIREAGVLPDRLQIIGKESAQPANPKDPEAAENRRVAIVDLAN